MEAVSNANAKLNIKNELQQYFGFDTFKGEQEQIITDDRNDWFPHISPDGQWMVFLAYEKGVTGHPGGKDVELRLMSMKDNKVRLIAKLFGGQGTINVPSWSPDSKKLAFVSYEELAERSPGLR